MPTPVHLRPLGRLDDPEVAPRFEAYLRELSAFMAGPTYAGGTYPWVDAWATEPGRFAWDLVHDGREVGFALVRTPASTGEPWHELAEFSIAPRYRGRRLGDAAMAEVFARHPGTWRIGVLLANARGDRFWHRVCAEHAAGEVADWCDDTHRWRAFDVTDPDPRTCALTRRLAHYVACNPTLARALDAVDALGLPGAAIGAGTVRAAVWDARFAGAQVAPSGDVDVIWCDAGAPLDEDVRLRDVLLIAYPTIEWDVINQAHVHTWHPGAPAALRTAVEGVASWPETATAVAISAADRRVIAPLGLDDLFAGIVRRNPVRVDADSWRRRLAKKRFAARWPGVRFADESS